VNQGKQKIPRGDLKDRFNAYLRRAVPGKEIAYFSRDEIVGALWDAFDAVDPPFPGALPLTDRQLVQAYYSGDQSEQSFDAAHQEKETLVKRFAQFLAASGRPNYILFSEAFYDDPSGEETKAFLLPSGYDFSTFMEEESLTGLMAAADTILSSEDFSRMLIFFHHDWYELYDRDFGAAFRAFVGRE